MAAAKSAATPTFPSLRLNDPFIALTPLFARAVPAPHVWFLHLTDCMLRLLAGLPPFNPAGSLHRPRPRSRPRAEVRTHEVLAADRPAEGLLRLGDPTAQDVGPVADREHPRLLLDHEDRRPLLAQLAYDDRGEPEGHLVAHEQLRSAQQGAREGQHLLLAARQRRRWQAEPAEQRREEVEESVAIALQDAAALAPQVAAEHEVLL